MTDKEKLIRGIFHFCKEHAGGILTLVASVGLIATAVEVGVATTKAQEVVEEKKKEREAWKESSGIDQPPITKEEIVKECWKLYIPAAATGIASISCIVAANVITARQQKSLAAAYALVETGYKKYRGKIVERFGKETDIQTANEVIVEQSEDADDFDDLDTGKKIVVYDSYNDRYFETTIAKIRRAMYVVNRNLSTQGCASLNDMYMALGVSLTEDGDSIGWSVDTLCEWMGECWLDYELDVCNMGNGEKAYIIDTMIAPSAGFSDEAPDGVPF